MSRRHGPTLKSATPATSRSDRFIDEQSRAEVLECIELFATLLVRYQFAREDALQHFADCMKRLPVELGVYPATDEDFAGDIYLPAEVLTRWFGLREFVRPDGQPKPLRLRGKGLTFTTLVHRISPSADPRRVLTYLLQIRAVIAIGNEYLPRERKALHRIQTRTLRAFDFKDTLALLRVSERNARAGRPREYKASTYGSIPQKRLTDFRKEMSKLADTALFSADEAMLRETNASPPDSCRVALTLGAYLSDTRPLRSLLTQRPNASKRKKPRR